MSIGPARSSRCLIGKGPAEGGVEAVIHGWSGPWGLLAWASVSSCPVSARIWRDRAAGLICLNSAFMVIFGLAPTVGSASARWCGVVAASYFLETLALVRTLEISFCWGRR